MRRVQEIYRNLLKEFVSFRSISTDEKYSGELEMCASWLHVVFEARGFDVRVITGYGNPIVVARYDAGKPETCLIYGHYDVQPAEISEGWTNDPFTLTERDGRLIARGVVDNKGQVAMHMASVFSLIEEGKLRYNVIFFIEGDEESDGSHIRQFVEVHQDLLKCNFCMVSDGQGIDNDPVFETSMRGVFNVEVIIRTAKTDLHSGLYGGIAANSSHYAARFIEKFSEALKLLGTPPDEERNLPPFDSRAFKEQTGGCLIVSSEEAPYRLGYYPSMEVTGLQGGYCGAGFRNAIPHETRIKINVRLPPNQSAKTCAQKFRDWTMKTLVQILPENATWNVSEIISPEDGVMLPVRYNSYLRKAKHIAEKVIGGPVYLRADGASIPVVRHMFEILSAPQVLLSLGNEDCNMHGVNENLTLVCMEQGLAISRMFFNSDTHP